MCMQFRITRGEAAAIVAVCVVLSPVLVPAGLVVAAGVKTKHGIQKIKRKRSVSGALYHMEDSNEVLRRALIKHNEFRKGVFHAAFEVAMALFFYQDFAGAGRYFREAIEILENSSEGEKATVAHFEQLALGHYFWANNYQILRDFASAKEHHLLAAEAFRGAATAPDATNIADLYGQSDKRVKEMIDERQCLVAAAYATYLQAIYAKAALEPSNGNMREDLLKEAKAVLLKSKNLTAKKGSEANDDDDDEVDGGDAAGWDSYAAQVMALIDYRLAVEPLQKRLLLNCSDESSPADSSATTAADMDLLRSAQAHTEDAERLLLEEFDSLLQSGTARQDAQDNLDGSRAEIMSMRVMIAAATRTIPLSTLREMAAEALRLNDTIPLADSIFANNADLGDSFSNYSDEDLVARWPLPSCVALEEKDAPVHHEMETVRAMKPTWCDHCMKFVVTDLRNKELLRCKRCKFECHVACGKAVAENFCLKGHEKTPTANAGNNATPPSSPTAVANHQHTLHPRLVHRPHKCVHCGKFIMMMTKALQCNQCSDCFCHVECSMHMKNAAIADCKM